MNDGSQATDLPKRVHDIVQRYVLKRTEDRAGMSWDSARTTDPKTGKQLIDERYRAAREKVCLDAFFRMRACRARQDFVEYFTGTVCSVPQFLPSGQYQMLAEALLGGDEDWERVKALSMLTLSGLSDL